MNILTHHYKKEKSVIHKVSLSVYAKRMIIIKLFFAILIIFGFWHITAKNIDPDLGWHLRVGEQIINTGNIPRQDIFSHTMPEFEWIDHEWLVDAWLFWMQINNLWLAVTVIFATLAFSPFLIWIIRARHLSWLWVIFLSAISITPFIGVRPQIISFFIFFIVFEMLRSSTSKHWEWVVLPVIFFIWANLHGGFIVGLILFASFLAAHQFHDKFKNWKLWKFHLKLENDQPTISRTQYNHALISFIISILATLINPYGWRLYGEIFTVITSSYAMKYIMEWASVASSGNIAILIFLACFLALFINYWQKYSAIALLPIILFFVMGVKTVRNFPLFLIIAMPFIFSAIELLRRDAIKSQKLAPFNARTWQILRFVAIILFMIPIAYAGYSTRDHQNSGYPEKAIVFMEQKIKNREWNNIVMLNEYNWGGYLIWRLPEVKVFIDGRMPHWIALDGNSAMKDYIAIIKSNSIKEKEGVLKKRRVNTIITMNRPKKEINKNQSLKNNEITQIINKINTFFYGEENTNLEEDLTKNGWSIAYKDQAAIILRHE